MKFFDKNALRLRRAVWLALLSGVLATGLGGCKKDVENTAPAAVASPTLVDVLNGAPNYTILRAAIQKTNLTALLTATTQFTLIAPTDNAFGQLPAPFNRVDSIQNLRTTRPQFTALQNIILNHIISGKYRAADLPAGGVSTQRSPSSPARRENQLYFVRPGGSGAVLVNGTVPLTQPDLEATNGYVHGVDQVLGGVTSAGVATYTATQTIAAIASANTSFSILVQALQRQAAAAANATPPTTSLLATLATDANQSNGRVANFTVFAPTNTAFQAFLASQGVTSLNQLSDAAVDALLRRHIVATRVFPAELSASQALTPLAAGTTLTIGGSGSAFTVRSSATGTPANIVGNSVFATNGYVYVIDQVL